MNDWEMSGPEEGDQVDLTVCVSNANHPNYDVVEITNPQLNLDDKKELGRILAWLLNLAGGVPLP